MSQTTFSDIEYGNRKRITKREEFLDIMDEIIPWEEWVEFVRPYYPSGKRGRPVKGIETMLRMYLLQTWFNLSDEGAEDAIYDSYAFRKFMKIDFMTEQVPDATTLLKFRHMIEKNHLGEEFFKAINRVMEATGHIMHGGTIIDATIINAPSSTKNAEKKRDPEMHQTKKGNEWKFGMKCNIGVDAGSGLVHSITATSANVHDIKGAILDAVDEGLVERDPTRKAIIKGKTPTAKKIKYLNQFELHTLISSLDLKAEVNWDWFILLVAKTGMRFSEALALTPSDFDFAHQM
ncbi:MAG: IS5 family transposase, partial [Oscillospiraceae bacterium]|nr:IS5 family transposase [Oscillospiraceae bacterium]